MIFNIWQTFNQFNKTGLDGMLTYVAHVEPIFIPMVLFGFFIIVLVGSFYSSKRLSMGGGDFSVAFAVAGFTTFLVSLVMTLIDGLINPFTVIICLIVAMLGVLFLFFSKKE